MIDVTINSRIANVPGKSTTLVEIEGSHIDLENVRLNRMEGSKPIAGLFVSNKSNVVRAYGLQIVNIHKPIEWAGCLGSIFGLFIELPTDVDTIRPTPVV